MLIITFMRRVLYLSQTTVMFWPHEYSGYSFVHISGEISQCLIWITDPILSYPILSYSNCMLEISVLRKLKLNEHAWGISTSKALVGQTCVMQVIKVTKNILLD